MSAPSVGLIVLRCADLDASREFYGLLGLSLVPEQHGKGPRHYSCTMGEVVLELYPLGTGPGTSGVRIGLRVREVSAVVAAIRVAGVGRVRSHSETPTITAVLKDPDGHSLQLDQAP